MKGRVLIRVQTIRSEPLGSCLTACDSSCESAPSSMLPTLSTEAKLVRFWLAWLQDGSTGPLLAISFSNLRKISTQTRRVGSNMAIWFSVYLLCRRQWICCSECVSKAVGRFWGAGWPVGRGWNRPFASSLRYIPEPCC